MLKRIAFASLAVLLFPTSGFAALYQATYSATLTSSLGIGNPAVGSRVTGGYLIDSTKAPAQSVSPYRADYTGTTEKWIDEWVAVNGNSIFDSRSSQLTSFGGFYAITNDQPSGQNQYDAITTQFSFKSTGLTNVINLNFSQSATSATWLSSIDLLAPFNIIFPASAFASLDFTSALGTSIPEIRAYAQLNSISFSLLSPVPEPSTYLLTCLGMLFVGTFRLTAHLKAKSQE